METPKNIGSYGGNYSEGGFWSVLGKVGKKVAKPALTLFYVLKEDSTPTRIKTLIIGALGYLILPVDLIPDFIPVVGWTDDLAALAAVIKMVSGYITPEIERKVKETVRSL
ncbi:MAG: YkvA family protein [Marinilabiliaceae bacterium]